MPQARVSPHATFVDAQASKATIDHLQETDVDLLGKTRVILQTPADALHIRSRHVVYEYHGVGVADRYRSQVQTRTVDGHRVAERLALRCRAVFGYERNSLRLDAGYAHVYSYAIGQ